MHLNTQIFYRGDVLKGQMGRIFLRDINGSTSGWATNMSVDPMGNILNNIVFLPSSVDKK